MNLPRIIKLTRGKLLLWIIFCIILIIAQIQTWGFCKDCGIPKPILYDATLWFPAWVIIVMLLVPLAILLIPFGQGLTTIIMGTLVIPILYFYLFTCVLAWIYQKFNHRSLQKITYSFVGLIVTVILGDIVLELVHGNALQPINITLAVSFISYALIGTAIPMMIYGFILAGIILWMQLFLHQKIPRFPKQLFENAIYVLFLGTLVITIIRIILELVN